MEGCVVVCAACAKGEEVLFSLALVYRYKLSYEVDQLIHVEAQGTTYLYCFRHCLAEELDLQVALGGVELLGIHSD